MLDLAGIKNILIVNTRSGEVKLTGAVMWGAWAVASYFQHLIEGADVKYLDENNEDEFIETFYDIVKSRDTVGFSLTSMQIKYTLPLIKYIKREYPHIRIIIGGIHPILFPFQDYGDLEVITKELPRKYFSYRLLPEKVKEVYRREQAQVVTGFSCSYKCTFCVNSVRNAIYEGSSVDNITADLDYVIREFKPPKIYFRDEDFFQDMNKAGAIIEHILTQKYTFDWDTNSRVTNFRYGKIDDDFLKKMVKSGCTRIRFGVESGSKRVLNFLKKGQNVEQIKNAVKKCSEHGISACCSTLIGIPTETPKEREETFLLISELHSYGSKVEIIGPQLYRPYPGGSLYEEAKKYGLIFPDNIEDWATYFDKNPSGDVFSNNVNYPWLSKRENKTLPYVWVLTHYGLNYSKSHNFIKKLISIWLLFHWRLRWFTGLDIKIFMHLRKKLLT